jgi:hypothetical protein
LKFSQAMALRSRPECTRESKGFPIRNDAILAVEDAVRFNFNIRGIQRSSLQIVNGYLPNMKRILHIMDSVRLRRDVVRRRTGMIGVLHEANDGGIGSN